MEILVIVVVILKSVIARKSKLVINRSEFADTVCFSDRMICVVINRYIVINISINYTDKLGNKVKRSVAKRAFACDIGKV